MTCENTSGQVETSRAAALQVVNAAEKAVLEASGRCNAEGRDEVRLAERFLGIARRRFLLEDWEEARLFGRLAVEYTERATQSSETADPTPDTLDPS